MEGSITRSKGKQHYRGNNVFIQSLVATGKIEICHHNTDWETRDDRYDDLSVTGCPGCGWNGVMGMFSYTDGKWFWDNSGDDVFANDLKYCAMCGIKLPYPDIVLSR